VGDDDVVDGTFPWLCLVPGPWSGYCFYGRAWLRVDRGGPDPESLAPSDWRREAVPIADGREPADVDSVEPPPPEAPPPGPAPEPMVDETLAPRYAELQASGFVAANHPIQGFDLRARAWLFVAGLDVDWTHLREPDSTTLEALNLLHFSTVGTLIAFPYVEAHALLGVDLLYGHDLTPAFGPGLEIRTYPARRFTVDLSSRLSVFADGYPLVDTRLDMGVALGRIDFLFGGRWFYQAYAAQQATSILGPSLSVLVRLGP
jgi:hypothetical protein